MNMSSPGVISPRLFCWMHDRPALRKFNTTYWTSQFTQTTVCKWFSCVFEFKQRSDFAERQKTSEVAERPPTRDRHQHWCCLRASVIIITCSAVYTEHQCLRTLQSSLLDQWTILGWKTEAAVNTASTEDRRPSKIQNGGFFNVKWNICWECTVQ